MIEQQNPELTEVDDLLEPGPDPEQTPAEVEPVDDEDLESIEDAPPPPPPVESAARIPEGNDYSGPNPSAPTPADAEPRPYNPPLKKGDRTAYVRKAQTYVRKYGKVGTCDVNGIFDSAFETQIKMLQGKHNLTVTGEVDDPTWELLRQLKADA